MGIVPCPVPPNSGVAAVVSGELSAGVTAGDPDPFPVTSICMTSSVTSRTDDVMSDVSNECSECESPPTECCDESSLFTAVEPVTLTPPFTTSKVVPWFDDSSRVEPLVSWIFRCLRSELGCV